MINFEKVPSLDGIAHGFRFLCSDDQITQIIEKTSLSESSVKSALRLSGSPKTITRVVNEIAISNQPIALI